MTKLPKVIPAVFPPLFGFVALAILWQGHGLILAGWLAAAIWAGFAGAYLMRILADPGIIKRDLDTLPGRTGTAAASMTLMLVALLVGRVSQVLGAVLLIAALLIHAALIIAFLARVKKDRNVRQVQPVWQMIFTGPVVAIPAAVIVGQLALGQLLLGYSVGVAFLIWGLSAMQLYLKRFPPPQLRPALAIHLSPAAMVGQGALICGYSGMADTFFWVSAAIVVALTVNIRWITAHGFSPFWGAFTFPSVGFAGLSFVVSGLFGWLMLLAATAITLYVLVRVLRLWYEDKLAALTFAA